MMDFVSLTIAAARTRAAAYAAGAMMLVALLFGLAGPVAAADAGTGADSHLVGCIAPYRAGDTAAAMFAQRARFDCQKPAHAWGPGSYWVRYTLPDGHAVKAPVDDLSPRQFSFVPQWQRSLAVSTRDDHGHVVTRWFGDADLSRYIGIDGVVSLPLGSPGHPVTDLLIRVDGALNASGLVGDPQVSDLTGLHGDELIAVAMLAAFGGLSFGLLCYNIVLWLTIRERFQLTYCLSLMAMLAYVWSSSAIMVQQFPGVMHSQRLATSYVMLAFAGALSLQFIIDFVEPDKLPPRLRHLTRQSGLVCVLLGFAVGLVPDPWRHFVDRTYAISFLPPAVLVVTLAAMAWRRGSRSIRILAIAWAFPLFMTLLRMAHAFNLVRFGPVIQYAMMVGMSFEALLSSLAMSYRIKLITDERDQARADERAARQLANIDSLTGLLNRRALLERLLAWESPDPLRLLLVDIDKFKAVNDRFGHLAGDEVLRGVAEVLALRADLNASVARIGGEEFALVGAATDLSEAVALGILADIRGQAMAGEVRVTVSVGMAEGPVRHEDDWRELYRRADAALYQAKAEGRNRAIHAPASVAHEFRTVAA